MPSGNKVTKTIQAKPIFVHQNEILASLSFHLSSGMRYLNANIAKAREMLKDRESSMRDQGQAAIQCTEEYVHSHPWQSIGIAAGVGFLLGLITRR